MKQNKIRFGPGSNRELKAMPSHGAGRAPVHAPILAPRHLVIRRFVAGFLICFLAALVALVYVVRSGTVMSVMENSATNALRSVVPPAVEAKLGKTDVSLHWLQGLGITYNDVTFVRKTDEKVMLSAERITLGVRARSLMDGRPEFSSIELAGARLEIGDESGGEMPQLQIANARSAFDNLFLSLEQMAAPRLAEQRGTWIKLTDLRLQLPENGYSAHVDVPNLKIESGGGLAAFEGEIVIDGRQVPIDGSLTLGPQDGAVDQQSDLSSVQSIIVNAEKLPMPWRRLQTIVSNDLSDHEPDMRHSPLLADVSVRLTNSDVDTADTVTVSVVPLDMSFKLDVGDYVPVTAPFVANMDFATPAITLRSSRWRVGRSSFDLSGRVRDSVNSSSSNVFDFEVLANNGVAAAGDSPEAPVRFAARAQGIGYLGDRLIQFSRLDVNSEAGEMEGEGEISLGGEFQTAIFKVFATDMSISGVKQFWPAPVARGARRWVLDNLAGGRVVSGQFDIAEPLRRRIDGTDRELTGSTEVQLDVEGVRFDVTGDIPPVRDADGQVSFVGGITQVTLEKGTVFLPSGQTADAKDGVLTILSADEKDGLIRANLDMGISGEARAIGELISFDPINADQFYPFSPTDLSGNVDGNVIVDFVLNGGEAGPQPDWSVDFNVANAASDADIEGRQLAGLDGRIKVDPSRADFDLTGQIDGLPADIAMVIPFGDSGVAPKRDIELNLATTDRKKIAPGLEEILTGTTPVRVLGEGEKVRIDADLTSAKLALPWIGWAKGEGVKAGAAFDLLQKGSNATITDFKLVGGSFGASGKIDVDEAGLKRVRFGAAQLNKGDDFALDIQRKGEGFVVGIKGKSLDARALMRHIRAEARKTTSSGGSTPVDVTAELNRVTGFHGESLSNVKMTARVRDGTVTEMSLRGSTPSGFPIFLDLKGAGSGRTIEIETLGAGEFLRFADIYTNVRGGTLNVSLRGTGPVSMAGKADIRDFKVFNEPKLAELVSSSANNSQSLEQAVNREIDTREVKFDVASSDLVFKPGRLDIAQAVARGPLAGFTIQGKVFDSKNQTRLTGTFLPAYGLNRIFGEIPILGLFLGNGRDRGLIGVTFKLEGSFDDPGVAVNPLSVIAPGIFRSIFEFQ